MRRNEQFIKSVILKRGGVTSFDVYPFSVPAVRHLDEIQFPAAVTCFVGENGSGKSTLLEGLAISSAGAGAPAAEGFLLFGGRPVGFTDAEHYVVTRAFLGDPDRMLRELLDDKRDGGIKPD